ncbi:hypothetical protein EMIT048CA2_220078 [Pseudomonas chlororaphis]
MKVLSSLAICFAGDHPAWGHERGTIYRGVKLTLLSHYGSRLAETIKLICTEFVIDGNLQGPCVARGLVRRVSRCIER